MDLKSSLASLLVVASTVGCSANGTSSGSLAPAADYYGNLTVKTMAEQCDGHHATYRESELSGESSSQSVFLNLSKDRTYEIIGGREMRAHLIQSGSWSVDGSTLVLDGAIRGTKISVNEKPGVEIRFPNSTTISEELAGQEIRFSLSSSEKSCDGQAGTKPVPKSPHQIPGVPSDALFRVEHCPEVKIPAGIDSGDVFVYNDCSHVVFQNVPSLKVNDVSMSITMSHGCIEGLNPKDFAGDILMKLDTSSEQRAALSAANPSLSVYELNVTGATMNFDPNLVLGLNGFADNWNASFNRGGICQLLKTGETNVEKANLDLQKFNRIFHMSYWTNLRNAKGIEERYDRQSPIPVN